MLLLSLLEVPLDLYKWREGYTHGRPAVQHILDSVLLSWQQVDNRVELALDDSVMRVYGYNKMHNPAYQMFSPLVEQGREQRGFPTVDLSVLGPHSLARMHLEETGMQVQTLGLLENLAAKQESVAKDGIYEVGQHGWHMAGCMGCVVV
jgi:hypothetical protein